MEKIIKPGAKPGSWVEVSVEELEARGEAGRQIIGAKEIFRTPEDEAKHAANTYPNTRAYILEEAKRCVLADRNTTYGKPEDNFLNTVRLWNEYLQAKGHSIVLAPADVAAFMILLKVARLSTNPEHSDSWVDVAGYAACGAECAKK